MLIKSLILGAVWLGYVQVRHRLAHGYFVPLALHADVVGDHASIGIPGVTKLYEATLTNYGILPASIEQCACMSDTMTPETMVAYNIERWNPAKHGWIRVMEFAKPEYCLSEPPNWGWDRVWLWPGQSRSTGEEATAARDAFKKGDRPRFVVVTNVTAKAKPQLGYPTPSFVLDEQALDTETPCRVRH